MTYRKIGGIHFVRLWRLQLMFCLTRKPLTRRQRDRRLARALAIQNGA
jgi:hypothetical protein